MNKSENPIHTLKRLFYFSRTCEFIAFVAVMFRIYSMDRSTIIFLDLLVIALLLGSIVGSSIFKKIAKRDFRCPYCGYTSINFAYKVAGWPRKKKDCPYCGKQYP